MMSLVCRVPAQVILDKNPRLRTVVNKVRRRTICK